ncbi:DUF1983 domain-containing protein [Pseudomonas sp. MF6772]|nr:DUF1983 domain-containing protein [Pseudomonas sp. MF6772]
MSGSIQSSNYVPGVSGWKLNTLTGEFEINSARPHSGVEAQMITVTAGDWSDYDLPANAIERYVFIGAELAKIPAEFRDSAEFTTEDISFDRDGSDYRTTLTYVRQETQEEAKARHEKAKVTGSRIVRAGGCISAIVDGVVRWRFGNLDAPLPEPEQPQPFKVDGDQIYINEAFIQDSNIGGKLDAHYSLKMQVNGRGDYVVAGIGMGLPSQFLASADRFAINQSEGANSILEALSGAIGTTQLCKSLKADIDKMKLDRLAEAGQTGAERPLLAEKVKDVIRTELLPGGLLHRSR